MKIRTSEVFRSFQGEGFYTGALSIWVRFFGCNLNCDGFMQKNPCDPKTYKLPYQTIDLSQIKKMEDLPVLEYGCDSGYSWSERFKHLATDDTEETLAAKITDLLPTEDKTWEHPNTGNFFDLCFTGGEPMMQQKAMIAVMKQLRFEVAANRPLRVQIETNGTKELTPAFVEYVKLLNENFVDVAFNISPKLSNVSGEKPERAWKPEVIKSYVDLNCGSPSLKFVVSNHKNCWKELDENVEILRNMGVDIPVFIMPVGATKEQQENSKVVAAIVEEAIKRGYHISGRVHATVFGNAMAT